MNKVFFTSDTHFGSPRTLELSKRPFEDSNQMDNELINQYNKLVGSNDIVYHLGDFGLYENLRLLNGKIILIWGNYELTQFIKDTDIVDVINKEYPIEFKKFIDMCVNNFSNAKYYSRDFIENYWRFIFNGSNFIPYDLKESFYAFNNKVRRAVLRFNDKLKSYGFYDVIDFNGCNMTLINSDDRLKKLSVHIQHEPVDCIMYNGSPVDFNLFGHIHGRQLVKPYGLDVGVDGHHFKPITKEDVFFFANAIELYYDVNVF